LLIIATSAQVKVYDMRGLCFKQNLRCDSSKYIAHIHLLQLISCLHQTESQMYVDLRQLPFRFFTFSYTRRRSRHCNKAHNRFWQFS